MHASLKAQSLAAQENGAVATPNQSTSIDSSRASTTSAGPVKALDAQGANTDTLDSHVLLPPHSSGTPALLPEGSDRSPSLSPSLVIERGLSLLKSASTGTYRFIQRGVREEWMAAPIAFAASLPATFFTCAAVVGMAPRLEKLFGGIDTVGFAISTSVAAVVLGYGSYLVIYWGGMLWKERGDILDPDGRFIPGKLAEKAEVMKLDFLLHLPNDIFTMATMGTAQGGLYVGGVSDLFWSIFLSQAAIDLFYCVKEPFYWRGAKEVVEWRRRRAAQDLHAGALEPANSDVKDTSKTEKRAAN